MSELNLRDIARAIEDSNLAFDDFKGAVMRRMDLIETAEAKARRGHMNLGLGRAEADGDADHPGRKAMRRFMCGEAEALKELSIEHKALTISTGSDGGYAVPKVIDAMIEALVVNISPIRSIARVTQISTSDYHRLVDTRGTASGWAAETEPRMASTTPTLADITPPMGDLYAYPQASQQMLDDVFFNAEQWLADSVSTEFARAEGAAFITGNGVLRPMGFLSGPAPVATADASRAFGTLEYVATSNSGAFRTLTSTVNPVDDLFALLFKLKAPYRANACWVMTKATLSQVAQMKDYQGRYVFSPTTAPGIPSTLLSYPVVEAEDMPEIAASSFSVALGDFRRGYEVVDRIGTRIVRDPFSNKPYVGFYVTKRVGGSVVNSEAIKLLKFSAS